MSEELKPCPFCDGKDLVIVDVPSSYCCFSDVRCRTCSCQLTDTDTHSVIEKWNDREELITRAELEWLLNIAQQRSKEDIQMLREYGYDPHQTDVDTLKKVSEIKERLK